MNKRPKISICISTLNRASYIGETLDSVISQASSDYEIVVLDGASTDNTEEVVRSRQPAFPKLRYVKLAANGGIDQDFDLAVQQGTGEYCWLMSDDDIAKPGALAAVRSAADLDRSLIILNAEVRNNDLTRLIESHRLQFAEDRTYETEELDRLFTETIGYLTFIGCVIIKRDLWMERERPQYYGSLFIHVGVIFQAPLPRGAVVIARPLIAIRYGNAMWKPKAFEIWMRKWPNLVWALPGLSEGAKNRISPTSFRGRLKALVLCRADGTYSMREYRNSIEPQPQWQRARLLWLARLIAVFPGSLLNVVVLGYLRTFGRGSALRLADMRSSPFYFRNLSKRRPRR